MYNLDMDQIIDRFLEDILKENKDWDGMFTKS
jgi:hypothetical protein